MCKVKTVKFGRRRGGDTSVYRRICGGGIHLNENSTQLELFSDGKTTETAAWVWKLKDAGVKMNF